MDLDFALACFDGETAAAESLYSARAPRGADPPWTREVGFVEHHRNGHLILRGTFAGHYVDVDETDHVSQKGAGEGAVAGGLVGVLLGPAGIALGLLVGGIIGSQVGDASETEPEPQALADQLRDLVPRSCSAIVVIAPAHDVDEMLAAVGDTARSTSRRSVTDEQAAALQASLSTTPLAAAPPRENPV